MTEMEMVCSFLRRELITDSIKMASWSKLNLKRLKSGFQPHSLTTCLRCVERRRSYWLRESVAAAICPAFSSALLVNQVIIRVVGLVIEKDDTVTYWAVLVATRQTLCIKDRCITLLSQAI